MSAPEGEGQRALRGAGEPENIHVSPGKPAGLASKKQLMGKLLQHRWPTFCGFETNVFFYLLYFQEGFVEFFRVPDPESTVRNTLMAVVGVAGIGATLAFLIR